MAISDVEILIQANTKSAEKAISDFASKASKSVESVQSSFSFLKAAAAAAATFLTGREILRGLERITDAAVEQEDALNRMNVAMKLSGDFSEAAASGFERLADELQKSSIFQDDAIIAQIAYAKNLGISNEQTESLIRTSVDLASALGVGLDTAVEALGKSLEGQGRQLGQLVPQTKRFTETQLAAGEALRFVEERFNGAGEASTGTFRGSLAQAGNSLNSLLATLGDYVTQNGFVLAAIKSANTLFSDFKKIIVENQKTILEFLKNGILILIEGLGVLTQVMKLLHQEFEGIVVDLKSVGRFVGSLGDIAEATAKSIAGLDLTPLRVLNNQLNRKTGEDTQALEKKLAIYDKLTEAIAKFSVQVERSGESQVRVAKKASDAFENQRKVIVKLSNERLQFFSQLGEKNLLAALTGRDEKFPVAGPNATAQQISDRSQALQAARFGAGISLVSSALQGAQGAAKTVSAIAGNIADTILPGIGGAVGEIVGVLGQGPEKVKEMIRAFAQALPDIIKNIVESIPVLIEELAKAVPEIVEKLVESMPKVAAELAAKMPFIATRLAVELAAQAPHIAVEFVTALVQNAPRFVTALIEEIGKTITNPGKALGIGGGGGGILGDIGGVLAAPFEAIGSVFGFAEGGKVPKGFPNDSFLAKLSSDEIIIPPGPSDQLERFLTQEQGPNGLNSRLARLESGGGIPRNVTVKLQVGERELASTILNLNRLGFRRS